MRGGESGDFSFFVYIVFSLLFLFFVMMMMMMMMNIDDNESDVYLCEGRCWAVTIHPGCIRSISLLTSGTMRDRLGLHPPPPP